MNELIRLGRITAPVGIKGEMRVYPYIEDKTRFSAVKKLLVDGKEYRVERVRYQKDMAVLKLQGIDDRNAAESLRNKILTLSRKDIWDNPEGTYFVADLVGMQVSDEAGVPVGTLKSVISNPANDLYEIETAEGRTLLLPAVKAFVLKVDIEKAQMTVRIPEGLDQL